MKHPKPVRVNPTVFVKSASTRFEGEPEFVIRHKLLFLLADKFVYEAFVQGVFVLQLVLPGSTGIRLAFEGLSAPIAIEGLPQRRKRHRKRTRHLTKFFIMMKIVL